MGDDDSNDDSDDGMMNKKLPAITSVVPSTTDEMQTITFVDTTNKNSHEVKRKTPLSLQFIRHRNAIYSKRKYYKNKKHFDELKSMKFQLMTDNQRLRDENEELQKMIELAEYLIENSDNREQEEFVQAREEGNLCTHIQEKQSLHQLTNDLLLGQMNQREQQFSAILSPPANSDSSRVPPFNRSDISIQNHLYSLPPSLASNHSPNVEMSSLQVLLHRECDRQQQLENTMLRQLLRQANNQGNCTDFFLPGTNIPIGYGAISASNRENIFQNMPIDDHIENLIPNPSLYHTMHIQQPPNISSILGHQEQVFSLIPARLSNTYILRLHLLLAQERQREIFYADSNTPQQQQNFTAGPVRNNRERDPRANFESSNSNSLFLQNFIASLANSPTP